MSSKPSTKKAVEEAREELKHADMGKFDRALRALMKVTGGKKPKPRFLKGGETVRLGVAGLGEQTQKVVKYKA